MRCVGRRRVAIWRRVSVRRSTLAVRVRVLSIWGRVVHLLWRWWGTHRRAVCNRRRRSRCLRTPHRCRAVVVLPGRLHRASGAAGRQKKKKRLERLIRNVLTRSKRNSVLAITLICLIRRSSVRGSFANAVVSSTWETGVRGGQFHYVAGVLSWYLFL